jgi:hypothetical protein
VQNIIATPPENISLTGPSVNPYPVKSVVTNENDDFGSKFGQRLDGWRRRHAILVPFPGN